MRIRAKRPLNFFAALRGGAWLAAILLVLHWSIPTLTLPQLNLGAHGPLEYSAEERDGQPAAASRLGGSSQGGQLRTDQSKREIIHVGGKTIAVVAEALTEFPVEPFFIRALHAASLPPVAQRRAFDARGPPSRGA